MALFSKKPNIVNTWEIPMIKLPTPITAIDSKAWELEITYVFPKLMGNNDFLILWSLFISLS